MRFGDKRQDEFVPLDVAADMRSSRKKHLPAWLKST